MTNMNIGSKLLLTLTLVASSTSFTACQSSEVANALGTAAIIGGAIVIVNNTRCEGGYVNRCHSYRDYSGRVVQECRNSYDDCAYLIPKSLKGLSDADLQTAAANADLAVTDVHWGQAFGMGYDDSGTFINAMKSARDGNQEALTNLGLNDSDITSLTQSKMVSATGVDTLAKKLNANTANVNYMLRNILRVTGEQATTFRQDQTTQSQLPSWSAGLFGTP